jgi:hypothetical protein
MFLHHLPLYVTASVKWFWPLVHLALRLHCMGKIVTLFDVSVQRSLCMGKIFTVYRYDLYVVWARLLQCVGAAYTLYG